MAHLVLFEFVSAENNDFPRLVLSQGGIDKILAERAGSACYKQYFIFYKLFVDRIHRVLTSPDSVEGVNLFSACSTAPAYIRLC